MTINVMIVSAISFCSFCIKMFLTGVTLIWIVQICSCGVIDSAELVFIAMPSLWSVFRLLTQYELEQLTPRAPCLLCVKILDDTDFICYQNGDDTSPIALLTTTRSLAAEYKKCSRRGYLKFSLIHISRNDVELSPLILISLLDYAFCDHLRPLAIIRMCEGLCRSTS